MKFYGFEEKVELINGWKQGNGSVARAIDWGWGWAVR